jgi:hypothetical protein
MILATVAHATSNASIVIITINLYYRLFSSTQSLGGGLSHLGGEADAVLGVFVGCAFGIGNLAGDTAAVTLALAGN